MVHFNEWTKNIFVVFVIEICGRMNLTPSGGIEKPFIFNEFEKVQILPFVGYRQFLNFGLCVQLKAFQFEIELISHELINALGVDSVEFGNEARCD